MNTLRNRLLLYCAFLLLGAVPCVGRAADTFISLNDFWLYLDNGVDQGTAWRNASFDYYFDWPLGVTQMGFGEGDEVVELNSAPGGIPLNTAYFVTSFSVGSAGNYSNLTVRLVRDDGAVVYINGVEVFRSNMPTGAVSYATKALRNIDGNDEFLLAQRVVPASVLISGENRLAVEVHQALGGNDDMSFALQLIGHRVGENQPPSANSSFVSVEQDKTVAVTLDATDPDHNLLSYALLSYPVHGSVSGTAPNLTYAPEPGYVGPDLFSFKATDGQWETEIAYVSIEVKVASNHPPEANSQTVAVDEDNALTVTLSGSDPDGDALTYTHTQTSHGVLTDGPGHSVIYQPAQNYFGPDSFMFTVDDGKGGVASGAVTITVTPVNDAPVAGAQSLSVAEDGSLAIVLTGTDVEGDSLSFSHGQPAHGVITGTGSHLSYQPAPNYNGPDSFNYTASDGNGGATSASIQIQVTPVNDVPVANDQNVTAPEDTAVEITLAASDVDGDALAYSYTQPSHGTVSGVGNAVAYQPAPNYNGPDSFNFTVTDGHGGTATATVSITVTPVNDNPMAGSQSVITAEDTPVGILLSASDADGDTLTYDYAQPAHGTVSGSGNNVVYHPAANYNGPDSFTFTVNDGHGGTATATVSITVTPVNDAPVAFASAASASDPTHFTRNLVLSVAQNQNAVVILSGSGSSDPDGNTLTCAWYQGSSSAPFSTEANPTLSLRAGSYAITLMVSDGTMTASDSITVQVETFGRCDSLNALAAQIRRLPLRPSERNGLLGHLNATCSILREGNVRAAVHQLNVFQARVANKVRDAATARALNAAAQRIIDELSGH